MIQWKNKKIKLNNKIKIMIFIFLEIFLIGGTVILCCLIDLDPKSSISIKTQQDTIYIDKNGKQVKTSEVDLSYIITKEVIQIGFYKNDQGEIQVVKMPVTIEKIPDKLPSEITSLQRMFAGNWTFIENISKWDTSNIINMEKMFENSSSFNQNISSWNTSKVTNMSSMFLQARKFNQDISSWNTSKVTDMSCMFREASIFNQNISSWNTSNVTDMSYMFYDARSFNQDISSWNVTKVTTHVNFADNSKINHSKKIPDAFI